MRHTVLYTGGVDGNNGKKTDSSITLPLTPIPTDPTPSIYTVSNYTHEMGVGGKWGLESEY